MSQGQTTDHVFLKAIDLNKACRMISPVKCKRIDRPGIWCTGRLHPTAPANVRGFSVQRVELRRCANGRPDNLYNLRDPALRPPTQSVLIGGLARTLSRGIFHSLHRGSHGATFCTSSISWPIRCQGAGLRPASPCIVCLTKWALCGRHPGAALSHYPQLPPAPG